MAARSAEFLVRARAAVILFWVAAAAACLIFLPGLEDAQSGSVGDLVPTDAEAIAAEERSHELFGFPLLARSVILQRDPGGLSPAVQLRAVQRAVALNQGALPGLTGVAGAIPLTNTLEDLPFAREQGTAVLTFLFFPPDIGALGRDGLTDRLVERQVSSRGDAYVGVTGTLPARAEQRDLVQAALPIMELATILLVTLVVGLHFRSIGAPLLNLFAIFLAYVVATHATAALGLLLEVSIPSEVRPVIVVLIFGVMTDYCVFFLSRHRALLEEGVSPHAAAQTASAGLFGIILTAGLAVAGASAALIVAKLGFLQAFGPGMALSVLVTILVALTFLPAALAVAGTRLYWPRLKTRPARPRHGHLASARNWLLRQAAYRPVATIAVCLLVLGAAASGVRHLEVGQTLIRGLPADSEPRAAYRAAAEAFVPGVLSPTVMLVEGEGIAVRRAGLRRLQTDLEQLPGVAAVIGPREQPTDQTFGAVYSARGDAARFAIVFRDDPLGAGAISSLRILRQRLPRMLEQAGLLGAATSFAGDTALSEETVTDTRTDLARVAPLALLIVFGVVALFLRAVVAPIQLVLASVVALAAAIGLTVYVFQGLLGHGEITFHVPFAAAVLLLALGSDYNVFIAGRIWQEARRRPLREAIVEAGGRASGAITVAGLVLAASFALLAIVPVRSFRELAFAMSVGLLLDALLVRTLLVPALLALRAR